MRTDGGTNGMVFLISAPEGHEKTKIILPLLLSFLTI